MASFWISLAAGAGIGLCYGAASFLTSRIALRKPRLFMLLAFGGMLLRMLLALSVIALILALTSVEPLAFLAGFFLLFLIGLATEIAAVLRHASEATAWHAPRPSSMTEAPDSTEPSPATFSTDT